MTWLTFLEIMRWFGVIGGGMLLAGMFLAMIGLLFD
jgi:hypothetical protein